MISGVHQSRNRSPFTLLLILFASCLCGQGVGATGQLELVITEGESPEPIACRMSIRGANGRPFHPKKAVFWHDHFLIPGRITLQLPLGSWQFEIERGPEYPVYSGHFQIRNFADDSKKIELARHVDMAKAGWWSGDLELYRPAQDMELIMAAEDLHVAQLINADKPARLKNAQRGLIQASGLRFAHLLGGMLASSGGWYLCFNLDSPLTITDAKDYPPAAALLRAIRPQPGRVWVDAGRAYGWDLPTLVALGLIDSVQVGSSQILRDRVAPEEPGGRPGDPMRYPAPFGNALWTQDIYFHLLNCGLRLPPSAGSGSGRTTNPAGYNRMYVQTGSTLNYDKWWEGFRAGRVTITNGPLLQPTVNGRYPGHVFEMAEGEQLELEIGLTFSTRDPISYLDIVKDGKVEHSIRFRDYLKTGRLPTVKFNRSGWVLIRAVTDLPKTYRFAMTAPYYVQSSAGPRVSKGSAKFFVDWVYQRARQIALSDPQQRAEVIEFHRQARDYWQGILAKANAE